jgi:hypothetical protein
MSNPIALGMPGVCELAVLAALALGIFVVVRLLVRKGNSQLPSAFPVISLDDGPGSYKVRGVDKDTRADIERTIQADSRANAQVKAELDGIVVTSIDKVG